MTYLVAIFSYSYPLIYALPGSRPAEYLLSKCILWPEVSVAKDPSRVTTVFDVITSTIAVVAGVPLRYTISPTASSFWKRVPTPVNLDASPLPEFAVVPVIPWWEVCWRLNGVTV